MKRRFYNGKVYTGTLPLRESFVTEDGRFIFVGTDKESLALGAQEDIDLEGRFVCAGFNDSHMHLLGYGHTLSVAPLAQHTRSLEDMLRCLGKTAPGRGGWILGRGWNQDLFTDTDRMPDRHDLDQVSKEHPVCAVRACGHALSVNSKALEILGIGPDTVQPEGGAVVMEQGRPNGVLLDSAMDLVLGKIPPPSVEDLKGMLRSACKAVNARGITSCQSDDYSTFQGLPWETVNEAYRQLEAAGELTVRVYEQANIPSLPELERYISMGNITGSGTDLFRAGPLKLLGDGALGARTAFLSRPYADDPQTRGLCIFTQEAFDALIGRAHRNGLQVAVHCIGDACLDMVLSSLRRSLEEVPGEDRRHGIVHCQITRPDQLETMASMGLHIYAQSIFLDYDIRIVAARCGEALAATSYSWKTLLEKGCTVSNGSDCPVELPDVLGGIQCAVTRRTLSGEGPYLEKEAFSPQEALDSFTKAGAYASFEERKKGQIMPGMLADFTVLSDDPFSLDSGSLKDIGVLATWLGGERVY